MLIEDADIYQIGLNLPLIFYSKHRTIVEVESPSIL